MAKPSKHPLRALLVNGTLMVVAFTLLGLAIWKNRDQIHDVLNRNLDVRLLAIAFAVYLTAIVLTFLRWYWLVGVVEPSFRPGAAVLLGFIGNLFNLVIPGAVGGDLIKAAYLVRMKVNKTQAIASMVIDRILGLLGLFVLAGIAGAVAWPVATTDVRRLIVVVWAAVAVGFLGLAAIFTQGLTRSFPGLLSGHGKVATILRELNVMSSTYRRRPGVVAGSLLLSSFVHGLFVVSFYLVSRTLFVKGLPTLGQHFLMVPLTLFTTAVPLPFGALGLSEQVSQQLFEMVKHPGGALAMMGFRVLMYGGGILCAGVYLANLRQVRGLTDTAEHLEEDFLEGNLDEPGAAPEPA
jgi:glycosyltransferase 2 family protein